MKLAIAITADPKSGVEACGVPKLEVHALAGTSGIASQRRYLAEGWQTPVF